MQVKQCYATGTDRRGTSLSRSTKEVKICKVGKHISVHPNTNLLTLFDNLFPYSLSELLDRLPNFLRGRYATSDFRVADEGLHRASDSHFYNCLYLFVDIGE